MPVVVFQGDTRKHHAPESKKERKECGFAPLFDQGRYIPIDSIISSNGLA